MITPSPNVWCKDLKTHLLYRLAYNADDPMLRGRIVVFRGWHQTSGDIRRARVCLLNQDGSCGTEYLVNQAIVIPH
jgi:hypothetical protein